MSDEEKKTKKKGLTADEKQEKMEEAVELLTDYAENDERATRKRIERKAERYIKKYGGSKAREAIMIDALEDILDIVAVKEDEAYEDAPYDPSDVAIIPREIALQHLVDRIESHEMVFDAAYQRTMGLWSKRAKSELIESLLLGIKLPNFYVQEDERGRYIVVDGLQRCDAFRWFFLEGGKLSKLKVLTNLSRATYKDLSRDLQRKLNETQLTFFIVAPGTPLEVQHAIFTRINSKGKSLNSQEIRNAICQGPVLDLAAECVDDTEFNLAVDGRWKPKRQKDVEAVVRFFVFWDAGVNATDYTSGKLNKEMLATMQRINTESDDQRTERFNVFYTAMNRAVELAVCAEMNAGEVFKKPESRSPNKAFYDALAVSLARLTDEEWQEVEENAADVMTQLRAELVEGAELYECVSKGTSDTRKSQRRHEIVRNILLDK